ncbi:MAG: hypothetical protein U1D97_14795 [Desulfuromonadales bacterium]|nr:hypothetical protein [Desulfuromonadales bacterium]
MMVTSGVKDKLPFPFARLNLIIIFIIKQLQYYCLRRIAGMQVVIYLSSASEQFDSSPQHPLKENCQMKKSLFLKFAVLLIIVSTLSGCIWVEPIGYRPGGGDNGHHRGKHGKH